MTMPVVILCGGQGTRFREQTERRPKPMIEVAGRPILWHIMSFYAGHGYKEFVLCLGYMGDVIKRYFLDYPLLDSDFTVKLGGKRDVDVHHCPSNDDWRVTLVDTGADAMTGCRIKRVERYLTGDHFHLTHLRIKSHGRTVAAARPQPTPKPKKLKVTVAAKSSTFTVLKIAHLRPGTLHFAVKAAKASGPVKVTVCVCAASGK